MSGLGISPEPGDLLWCRFPYKENLGPGLKPRPVLVIAVMEDRQPFLLRVAYGTSRDVLNARSGEILIDETNAPAYHASGLSRPTRISFRHVVVVPFTPLWFPRVPGRRTCRLGKIHASLMPLLTRAAKEAGLIR